MGLEWCVRPALAAYMNQTKTLQQQIGEIYRAKALIATHQAHGRRTRWTRTREIRFLFKIFSPKHPTMSKSPLFASGETLFIRVFVWSVAFFVACEFIRLFVFHQIFVFYSLCSSCPWLADSTTSFLAPFFFSFYILFSEQTNVLPQLKQLRHVPGNDVPCDTGDTRRWPI